MFTAVMFLLDHLIKHGDSHVSAQAKRHKQMLEEENAPVNALVEILPHQGSQSPQKTDDGLGGTTSGDAENGDTV